MEAINVKTYKYLAGEGKKHTHTQTNKMGWGEPEREDSKSFSKLSSKSRLTSGHGCLVIKPKLNNWHGYHKKYKRYVCDSRDTRHNQCSAVTNPRLKRTKAFISYDTFTLESKVFSLN